jgi:hypothetical protein
MTLFPESPDYEDLEQIIEMMGHDVNGWFVDYNLAIHGYIADIQGAGGDIVFFSPGDRSQPVIGTTKSIHGNTYYIAVSERRDIGDKTPYLWIALLTKYPPPLPPVIWSSLNGNLFAGTFIINFGKSVTIPDESYEIYRTFDGTNFHYLARIVSGPFTDYNVPPLTYVGYKIRTVDKYKRYSNFTNVVWSYAPWSRYLSNPILSPASGWDSFGHFSPFIAYDGDQYHLFASGCTGTSTGYQIGHWTLPASSWNIGAYTRWTADPANPVIAPSGAGYMSLGVAESSIFRYANYWWQLFTGYDNHAGTLMDAAGIGLTWAQSLNGPWTVVSDTVPLVDLGGVGEWDYHDVFGANMMFKNGEFKLYYSGGPNTSDAWRIGLATSASVFGPYTKSSSNPVLTPGASGEWDDVNVNHPRLIDWDQWLILHYNGNSVPLPSLGRFQVGEGYTEDFTTLIKSPFNPCLGHTDGNEINLRIGHQVFRKPGTNEYYMAYSSADDPTTGIWINLARLWR